MPRQIYTIDDAQRRAKSRLPKMLYDFIAGASGDESLHDKNSQALNEVRLMPRVLRNISKRSLSCQILGLEADYPFGFAPMGMTNLAWPGADKFMAKEASQRRIPLCVSTASSSTLEQIIADADGYAWFQLYADQSPDFVDELVSRAEAANYSTLIFTVDVPIPSVRARDLKNGFAMPMRWGPSQIWDFASHPRWTLATLAYSIRNGLPKPMNYATSSQKTKFIRKASRDAADWGFLSKLRDKWRGKLIIKGVQCPEDAIRIKAMGADAIYVSNHGGRQLNAAPVSIHSLTQIRQAVGHDMPLIFDSGIRSGEHVIKAIALGADFVMLGRSVMFGLGAGGAAGLSNILDVIGDEASAVMGLIGQTQVSDIDEYCLASSHGYLSSQDMQRSVAE